MDKNAFKGMIGILGSYLIADRIFQSIDTDMDGLVSLEDYLVYCNVIAYGTDEERNRHTFDKIDIKRRGLVNYSEFKEFFYTYIELQQVMMQEPGQANRLFSEEYLQFTFNQISKDQREFNFEMFIEAKEENPRLFEFLE
jgi:Ca2+-binding EF-hand superfamily protein